MKSPLIIHPKLEAFYFPNWLSNEEAETLFGALKKLPWQEEWLEMFGRKIKVPRKVIWIADTGKVYRYSGVDHIPLSWPKCLITLRDKLKKQGYDFNSVLGNWYQHGDDYMGWHADRETELGKQPTIASISLGANRRFCFRNNCTKEKVELILENASLLVMRGNSQSEWQHCLPKTKKILNPRINLTFRTIYQPELKM